MAAAAGTGRGRRAGAGLGLSLRAVCALAYVLWLEEVDRQTAVHTQAALFALAMGGDAEIPDPNRIRARFDELLAAEPVEAGEQSRADTLREAFGLSGG